MSIESKSAPSTVVARLVAGSMRDSRPDSVPTHTLPAANAWACGLDSTSIVASTRFVRRSIRDTSPLRLLVTHTLPCASITCSAPMSVWTVATTSSVAGSILDTDPLTTLVTHAAPSLTAT